MFAAAEQNGTPYRLQRTLVNYLEGSQTPSSQDTVRLTLSKTFTSHRQGPQGPMCPPPGNGDIFGVSCLLFIWRFCDWQDGVSSHTGHRRSLGRLKAEDGEQNTLPHTPVIKSNLTEFQSWKFGQWLGFVFIFNEGKRFCILCMQKGYFWWINKNIFARLLSERWRVMEHLHWQEPRRASNPTFPFYRGINGGSETIKDFLFFFCQYQSLNSGLQAC
jgi:hypothetical protein